MLRYCLSEGLSHGLMLPHFCCRCPFAEKNAIRVLLVIAQQVLNVRFEMRV